MIGLPSATDASIQVEPSYLQSLGVSSASYGRSWELRGGTGVPAFTGCSCYKKYLEWEEGTLENLTYMEFHPSSNPPPKIQNKTGNLLVAVVPAGR